MPNVITHALQGREVVRGVSGGLEKIIQRNMQLFSMGTSGPDFFFYYNAYPWMDQKKAKEVSNIGNKIHSSHINRFFSEVFTEVKNHQTQEKISYVCGLLCHWSLDKVAHPYIFYRSDDITPYEHRRFESHLDYIMLTIVGKSISEFPSYQQVDHTDAMISVVSDVYCHAVNTVYGVLCDYRMVKKSFSHFKSIQRLLFDPTGKKLTFFYSLEKNILKKPHAFSSMIVPLQPDELDILNSKKKTWYHPCTKTERNESFVELFNTSIAVGIEVCNLFYSYLKNDVSLEDCLSFINNQSYETGLSYECEMKFFDCIYANKQ